MRLHYSFGVCALTIVTLAGCTASSGGRATSYHSGVGHGGGSSVGSHSYDADPPRPSLATSPLPATQTIFILLFFTQWREL